jgi:biotin carboxyl carrier protein
MGHAYTPGLKVSAAAEFVRSRMLPIPGEVLVDIGAHVEPDTVVARALLPGNVSIAHLARELGVAAADLGDLMLVKVGDEVTEGQPVAQSKGIFGIGKKSIEAPTTGVLESISKVSGQVIYRGAPIPVDVKAYIAGTVTAVTPTFGADITARGTMVQGIFGIGPEVYGTITMAAKDPSEPLEPGDIKPEHKNAIVVGGSIASLATLRAAIKTGVRAVIVGGIDADDLKELLGFDLGVAITGNETLGLTVVVTEGFGPLPMAGKTFRLLSDAAGRTASVSGATQIRAGVLRPELLVPGAVGAVEETAVDSGQLVLESSVRIIRDPHFGALARVVDLPHEPRKLETESAVRILTVALADGEQVTLPRANVELVDERL